MIAKLKGFVESVDLDHLVIDVGGVGYLVFASARTLRRAGATGEPTALLIETHVRENHIHLYGFIDKGERDWFRMLQTVAGVGAKAALAICSVLEPDALAMAIAAGDRATICRADGVGPKLAARILTDLKDRAGGIALGVSIAAVVPVAEPDNVGPMHDAVSALVHLGYSRAEAFAAVVRVMTDEQNDIQAIIKAALKELSA
ncbi:MAG: Holliday junction branch migration protein RuvA [Pseudomonadota bacterium]|nr:Holliday junction branch migration protein RuvA [Pseudomonadota bacterium]